MNKEKAIAIVRIVLPAIFGVLGVLGITSFGGIELSEATVEQAVSMLAVLIGALYSIRTGWKNNNVTEAARKAQIVLNDLKAENEMPNHPCKPEHYKE